MYFNCKKKCVLAFIACTLLLCTSTFAQTCNPTNTLTTNNGNFEGFGSTSSCSWLINPSSVSAPYVNTQLTFLNITLEPGDSLVVYNGSSTSSPQLASFTQTRENSPVTISSDYGPILFVVLTSSTGNPTTGFTAKWVTDLTCSGAVTYVGAEGVFRTHQDQESLKPSNGRRCEWIIRPDNPPANSVLQVVFEAFDLTVVYGQNLYAFDHTNVSVPLATLTPNGTNMVSFYVIASGPEIRFMVDIDYYSYTLGKFKGIKARWSLQPLTPVQCSGDLSISNTGGYFQDHAGVAGVNDYVLGAYTCGWVIDVSGGNASSTARAVVNLVNLDLAVGDSLKFFDGQTSSNNLIKSLTSATPVESRQIYASQTRIYVLFTSNGVSSAKGFTALYGAAPQGNFCNGLVTKSTLYRDNIYIGDYISDHISGGQYASNLACAWLIQPDYYWGDQYTRPVTRTDLSAVSLGSGDTLTFYDGTNSSAPILKQFIGPIIDNTFYTFYSSEIPLYVTFTSDNTDAGLGFRFYWATSSACWGTLTYTALSGTISSQVGGSPYLKPIPYIAECYWEIRPAAVAPNSTIQFILIEYDQYMDDNLKLFQGDKLTTQIGPIYTPVNVPQPLIVNVDYTNNNTLQAKVYLMYNWWGNNQKNYKGMLMSYNVYAPNQFETCSGLQTYNSTSGYFQDHVGLLGRTNYTSSVDCFWLIDVSDRQNSSIMNRALLSFVFLDIAAGDFLDIYDGENTSAGKLLTLSGPTLLPIKIYSTQPRVLVHFYTASNTVGAGGWALSYSTVSPTRFCTGEVEYTTIFPISLLGGTITDHLGGGVYPANTHCTWKIVPPVDNYNVLPYSNTRLTVSNINLGAGDVLTFYDGPNSSSPILGQFVGPYVYNLEYAYYTSTGVSATIELISDNDYPGYGFSLGYTTSSACRGLMILESPTGLISTREPNAPVVRTPPYAPRCQWQIRPKNVTAYSQLQLIIIQWDTAPADQLAVYEGENYDKRILLYTNSIATSYIINITPNVTTQALVTYDVNWYENNGGTKLGMTIDYAVYEPGYVSQYSGLHVITSPSGLIRSHDGPIGESNYTSSVDHMWLIDVSAMSASNTSAIRRVVITLMFFDIRDGDYLMIYDGNSTDSSKIANLTGSSNITLPLVITTTQSRVLVHFTSSVNSMGGGGYGISYTTVVPTEFCRGFVLLDQLFTNGVRLGGDIYDHNGGGNYPGNSDCSWLIKVPVNGDTTYDVATTLVDLTSINLGAGDVLSFYDGENETAPLLGRLEGPIKFTGHLYFESTKVPLYAHFTSDHDYQGTGFALSYSTSQACRGKLYWASKAGLLTTNPVLPYLKVPPYASACEWYLQPTNVVPYSIIQFILAVFDINDYDSLSINKGLQLNQQVAQYTSMTPNIINVLNIESEIPQAYVRFDPNWYGNNHANYLGMKMFYQVYAPGESAPYTGRQITNTSNGLIKDHYGPLGITNYTAGNINEWLIDVKSKTNESDILRVKLDLVFFDVKIGDSVVIYEGSTTQDSKLVVLTGNVTLPYTIITTQPQILVRFESAPNSQTGGGYAIAYSTVQATNFCSGQRDITSIFNENYSLGGSLTDHTGGGLYQPNADCAWLINPGVDFYNILPTATTRATITRINLAAGDTLTLHDGLNSSAPIIVRLVGPLDLTRSITYESTGVPMFVHFESDQDFQGTGFNIDYSTSQACRGKLYLDNVVGLIDTNPKAPYLKVPPYSSSCEWYIQPTNPSPNSIIQLILTKFDINEYDALNVYTGSTFSTVVVQYTSTSTISPIITLDPSTPAQAYVRYDPNWWGNNNGNYAGMKMIYKVYTSSAGLPYTGLHTSNTSTGFITSHNGPLSISNYIPGNIHMWLIDVSTATPTATFNDRVELEFVYFDVNPGDKVIIYDGPTTSSPIMVDLSGPLTLPYTLTSTQSRVLVYFESASGSSGAGGYGIAYSSVAPGQFCSGLTVFDEAYMNTQLGDEFNDHQGGGLYAAGSDCSWLINPKISSDIPETSTTRVDISNLHLAVGDVLSIYDGVNSSSILLGRYTGPLEISGHVYHESIKSVALFVHFESDSNYQSTGFSISYSTSPVCRGNVVLNDLQGEISTVGPHSQYFKMPIYSPGCQWTLQPAGAAPGSTLQLVITLFDMDPTDVFAIYQGPNLNQQLAYYSGYAANHIFNVDLDSAVQVMVGFVGNWYNNQVNNYKGIKIAYKVYGPAHTVVQYSGEKTLQDKSGYIRDHDGPLMTSSYTPNANSVWNIDVTNTTDPNTIVELNFVVVNLLPGDYLYIYDKVNSSTEPMAVLTNTANTGAFTLTSASNIVSLHFITASDSLGEYGFAVGYITLPCPSSKDQCGICAGNNLCLSGCDHTPYSTLSYDSCGVCGGNNSTCLGCDGVPNSGKELDGCNVCGGNNSTCAGCDGIPYSNFTRDACGVCRGDNTTCLGCDGIVNSNKVNDSCGVCGGNNSTCAGCDGVANSGKKNDVCGLCGGNNSTCISGCDEKPNSVKVYDACGVCGGQNTTCTIGCDGITPNKFYDACGVCGGDNSTCKTGCDNGIFSTKAYDSCGVCGGNNSTCLSGCDNAPNSQKVFDGCGVCGGDNSTCPTQPPTQPATQPPTQPPTTQQPTTQQPTTQQPTQPRPCGDGICNANGGENCVNCPVDCVAPCGLCGDGLCDATASENCATCSKDCGKGPCGQCGDGFCDPKHNETCSTCFNDCGLCESEKPCPGNPPCNNRGSCLHSVCTCQGSYSGPACEQKNLPIHTSTTTNNTHVIIPGPGLVISPQIENPSKPEDPIEFVIAFSQIREISSKQVVQSYNLTNVRTTQKQSVVRIDDQDVDNWNYTLHFDNDATMQVSIWFFTNPATIQFANTSVDLSASSIKYLVTVTNWPFQSVQNKLQLALQANSDQYSDNTCGNEINTQENDGNLQWYKMNVGPIALYGKFIEAAIIDGRISHVKFMQDEIDRSTVWVTSPIFWDSLTFDPNFSVLLETDDQIKKQTDACGNSLQKEGEPTTDYTPVYAGVAGGVAGAAMIGAGVMYYQSRRRKAIFSKRMQKRMSENRML